MKLFDVDDKFTRPVEFKIPSGGGWKKYPCKVTFEYLSGADLKARMAEFQLTKDFLASVIKGWTDLRVAGSPVEFTDENLAAILEYESVVNTLQTTYGLAVQGENSGAKN